MKELNVSKQTFEDLPWANFPIFCLTQANSTIFFHAQWSTSMKLVSNLQNLAVEVVILYHKIFYQSWKYFHARF